MRGQGFVYQPTYKQDGEKRTVATWYVSYSVHGKQIRESSHSTVKADAVDLLKRRVADKRPAEQTRLKFTDLAQIVTTDYITNGRKSLKRAKQSLQHLREYFRDGQRCSKIDRAAVSDYVAHRLSQGVKNATVNREVATLKKGLRLAGLPSDFIRTLKEGPPRKGFFERAQLDAVLAELPEYLRPLALSGFITGWRVRELTSRRWQNVEWDTGWLRLEPGESKTDEPRMFPLIPELRTVLESQNDGRSEFVFHYPNGNPIGQYDGAWRRACRRAGLEDKVFHDFRRSAARNLIRSGVPQIVAQRITGHKTASIFTRYAITDEAMLRDAGENLAKFHATESRARPMTAGEIARLAKARLTSRS